jgi:hypothetical protein
VLARCMKNSDAHRAPLQFKRQRDKGSKGRLTSCGG